MCKMWYPKSINSRMYKIIMFLLSLHVVLLIANYTIRCIDV